MIVQMKKICLAVQDRNQDEALNRLRDIGVIHLEKVGAASEKLTNAFGHKEKAETALGLISSYKTPKKKKPRMSDNASRERRASTPASARRGRRATDRWGIEEDEPYSLEAVNAPVRPDLIDYMLSVAKEHKELEGRQAILAREHNRIAEWGEFKPEKVHELAALGVPVFLYKLTPEAFAKIPKEQSYIKLNEDKTAVFLLVPYKELPGLAQFKIPEKSLSELDAELNEVNSKLEVINARIKSLADRRPVLEKEVSAIMQEIEFETARADLMQIEETPAELGVSVLRGYVPAEDMGRLKAAAAEHGWALAAYDPAPQDIPPTLLKNNKVARFIQPLLSFLGTVPGYKEFDISPSYLLFFGLFFAMIFGDAAYGLIIIGVSLMIGVGFMKKSGKLPDAIKLFLLLGCCTVVWGSINGTWFAIPAEHLPGFLTALIIPQFNSTGALAEFPAFMQNVFNLPETIPEGELKTRWNVQFLCFSVAVIQLVWARSKRAITLLPSLSAVAQVGWMLMMIGLYFMVLFLLLKIALPDFVVPLIAAGIALNVIFAEQKGGNFFANIGKGFGGLFQLVLKTISGFADIISYIRLFAVGFAGTMIAQIFNNMALGSGLGEFGVGFIFKLIAAVLILCLGHALNLALTSLSVLVHGVRLNLLEYAGNHLEMEWSGYAYDPFALKQKKD